MFSPKVFHDGGFYHNRRVDCLVTFLLIDAAVPCLGDYAVPQDNYCRKKHRRWEAQEAENIRQYIARPR